MVPFLSRLYSAQQVLRCASATFSNMTCFEGGGNTRLLYCCTILRVCRVATVAVSTGVALCLYDIQTQHLSKEEGSHGCSTTSRKNRAATADATYSRTSTRHESDTRSVSEKQAQQRCFCCAAAVCVSQHRYCCCVCCCYVLLDCGLLCAW